MSNTKITTVFIAVVIMPIVYTAMHLSKENYPGAITWLLTIKIMIDVYINITKKSQ